MTLHLADVAAYQGGLTIQQYRDAGFPALNFKTSHGVDPAPESVHPRITFMVSGARLLEMPLASFHWLTADATGTDQAEHAYRQLQVLGLTARAAHVVDVEAAGITAKIYGDYVATMTHLLGRPIVTYSGDWWAASRPWLKPSLASPWLMGAPAAGYQPEYPGDDSPMWEDGYAGYTELAIMQYRVAKIDGIKVSQSAIRSMDIWADMTGVARMAWVNIPAADSLVKEINQLAPGRDRASDGSIGDGEHSARSSDHNPDETGATPYEDSDSANEVHARDVDMSGPWPSGWSMERIVQTVLARCRSGAEVRLQNIIFNERIWSRSTGWASRAYTGSNPHDKHAHFSFRYGSGSAPGNPEQITSPWGILAAYQQEEDVTLTADDKAWIDARFNAAPDKLLDTKYGSTAYPGRTVRATIKDLASARDYQIGDAKAPALPAGAPLAQLKLLPTLLAAIQSGSVDVEALAAALAPVLAPLIPDDQDITPELLREAFRGL